MSESRNRPLASQANGERLVVRRGDEVAVSGNPALSIENYDVVARNVGQLTSDGDAAAVQIDGDDARLVNRRAGSITGDDAAVEINGEDARVTNSRGASIQGETTGIRVNEEDARIVNTRGASIEGTETAIEVNGEDARIVNSRRASIEAEGTAIEVNGENARIVNSRRASIEADDTAIEINEEDATVINRRTASIEAGQTAIEVNAEDARIVNAGSISGGFNGVSFAFEGETSSRLSNRGEITSDSRVVNIDGDGVTVINRGELRGTGDQRDGTVYADSSADNYRIDNRGTIDAGEGNQGAGISLSLGDEVDATVENSGSIDGRGNAAANTTLAGDGIRLSSGVDGPSVFTGEITNDGRISSEGANGTVAGVRVANGVDFQGTLTNGPDGEISGVQNGVYFGVGDHEGGSFLNQGTVTSDSRAVNLDGDGLSFVNQGTVLGTGDQRNGTTYIDGTGDDISVTNEGTIDAGAGNLGDGISVQVGSAAEDATNENIAIVNEGDILGRGQAAFDGGRLASNGSSGVRFFNGSGTPEATVTGSVVNSGTISAEVDVGFLGGLVVEDGVAFEGTITNEEGGLISGPRNGLYIGNAEHDLDIENDGRIESGSRAVNLDGDNVTFENRGEVAGIGDQRNGTLYVDGTGDNIDVTNEGTIDAGLGNSGSGVSVQVGATSEDALSEDVNIVNDGLIQGRGDGNVPAGVRLFVGSGLETATFAGDITNQNDGVIASETDAGILIEEDVIFDGTITNDGTIQGGNGLAIDAQGALGNVDVVNNGTLVGDVRLGEGADSFVQNGDGDVVVSGGGGSDSLTGGDGNDTLLGGGGGDTLLGGDGDDFVQGGGGNDITDGGAGIDTVSFADIGAPVTVDLAAGNAQYNAPNGNLIVDQVENFENVLGSANDDIISGDAQDNVLTGGLGNDALNGGDGIDTADFSDVDVPVNVVLDANGNGTATRETGFGVSFENVAVDSLNPGAVADDAAFVTEALAGNLYFNVHTNDFNGGEIRGQLDGLVSDETVDGVRTIVLEAELDASQEPGPTSDSEATGTATVSIVVAADGSATYSTDLDISGLATSDLLPVAGVSSIHLHNAPRGVNGPVILDVVQDAGGDVDGVAQSPEADTGDGDVFAEVVETDTLTSIENVILSDDADSFVSTGGLASVVDGGAGDDVLIGGGGNDVTDGGEGIDTASFADIGVGVVANLSDEAVPDQFGGNVEPNQAVYFPGGPDGPRIVDELASIENLLGSANDDTLVGSGEGNELNGGGGNDILTGNFDSDTFVFERETDQDVVTDFETSEDLLDLTDFGFADVQEVQAAAQEVLVDGNVATVIDLDGDAGADQVTLLGVAVNDLNSGNVLVEDEAGV